MQVARWGNSLDVRLPADLVPELGLKEGDQIDLVKDDGTVLVRRQPRADEVLRLRVRTSKRGRVAHIPITPALADVIDSAPGDRMLILANASGGQLTKHRASEGLRRWRDKAGLRSELRLQDCKATAATRLLDAGPSFADCEPHGLVAPPCGQCDRTLRSGFPG